MQKVVLFFAVTILGASVSVPMESRAQQRSDQSAPDVALHPRVTNRQEIEDFKAAESVTGANSA